MNHRTTRPRRAQQPPELAGSGDTTSDTVGVGSLPTMLGYSRRRIVLWIAVGMVALGAAAAISGGYRKALDDRYRVAALLANDNGNWGELATITRLWLDHDPDNGQALLFASLAASQRNHADEALRQLERIAPNDPFFAAGLAGQADLYRGPLNQPLRAIELLERATTIDPQNVTVHRELLRLYGMTFQRDALKRESRRAIAAGSDTPATFVYLLASELVIYSEGEATTERWTESNNDSEMFEVANLLHAFKRIELAETSMAEGAIEASDAEKKSLTQRLDQLSTRYPTNMELLFLQGDLARQAGDTTRLSAILAQVPSSASGDARPWRLKGALHQLRDEPAPAEAAFRRAIEIDPFDWASYHQLAETLRQRGLVEQATPILEIAQAGNEFRRMVLRLGNIDTLNPDILDQMLRYTKLIGENEISGVIESRIARARTVASTDRPHTAEPPRS